MGKAPDIFHVLSRLYIYSAPKRPGVSSAVYGNVHYKEPLKSLYKSNA